MSIYSEEANNACSLLDPVSYRTTTVRLAKATGGRCFSVRYRLAPQSPFPAAILDALVAYLSLLSPPPGALHDPVPAKNIVFAGDSAGGGLSIALLQTILTIRRLYDSPTIRFHGKDVPIELPGGAAVCCPYLDVTRSLPSQTENAPYDYLPTPRPVVDGVYQPTQYPSDQFWPTAKPRVELYCDAKTLMHPLICAVAAPKELWKDSPPIFVGCAQDSLEDDGLYFSRKLAEVGAPVVCERFEGMPHVLPTIILWSANARKFMKDWAGFCVKAAKGIVEVPDGAIFVNHTGTKSELRKWDTVGVMKDEEIYDRIKVTKDAIVKLEDEIQDVWRRKNGARL